MIPALSVPPARKLSIFVVNSKEILKALKIGAPVMLENNTRSPDLHINVTKPLVTSEAS